MGNFNVVFATSKLYLQYFTVAATSLLENNAGLDIKIFVIHEDMDTAALDVPKAFFKQRYQQCITFISIGDKDFTRFRTNEYFGKYTYYRLFVADLLPMEVDSCLFMDVDTIVTTSLKDIAEVQMSGYPIAAVAEVSVDDNLIRLNQLGVQINTYFNAGVLLINVELWRREKLSEKFVEIAQRYDGQLKWVDQDILNIYFKDDWLELNRKYNAIHILEKMPVTPVIIHYNTVSKPWHYVDTHPYNAFYQLYKKITPYKNVPGSGYSLRNFIIKNGRLIKRKLRQAGLLK